MTSNKTIAEVFSSNPEQASRIQEYLDAGWLVLNPNTSSLLPVYKFYVALEDEHQQLLATTSEVRTLLSLGATIELEFQKVEDVFGHLATYETDYLAYGTASSGLTVVVPDDNKSNKKLLDHLSRFHEFSINIECQDKDELDFKASPTETIPVVTCTITEQDTPADFIPDVLEYLDNIIESFLDNAPDSIIKALYGAWNRRAIEINYTGKSLPLGLVAAVENSNKALGIKRGFAPSLEEDAQRNTILLKTI